jgi:hypothetical protein
MKNLYAALIVLGLLAGMAGVYVIRNWDPYRDIPQLTLARLNESEANWYAAGILDYDARITVAFSSERRQYEVSVRGGALSEARSAGWDDALGDWGPASPVSAEEGGFFTIPGLFATLRSALFNDAVPREVLRMEIASTLPHPSRLVLGEILEEGFPVDGTEVLIEVLEFERR